jgi:hypothetical protein
MKWKYQSLLMFLSHQIRLADKLNIFEIEKSKLADVDQQICFMQV